MVKIILFDCDGLIIKHEKYFSQRLKEQKNIDVNAEGETAFFKNEFLECETGKRDLKQELAKKLPVWGWQGTVGELMEFWFFGEANLDLEMKEYIIGLRKTGIKCFLSTNNEKYRTEYLLNQVGLKTFLDGAYSSCNVGFLKPAMEFWQEVYKDFTAMPKDEILVWDDQRPAIDSAKKFGLNAEFYENFENFKKIMAEKYNFNA